ncbi:MAG: hypothetical protein K6G30_12290 [Acetatifactor sp.]|nr:hypothetical protein [Acetatifactor sp.]
MRPEDYSWNEHERKMLMTGKAVIPSPRKIAIQDDDEKRLELEKILEQMSHKVLALWAMQNSMAFIAYIHLEDDTRKDCVVEETTETFYKRISGEIGASELRKAGFLANTLAKESTSDMSRYAARVYAQAIATGHMRGHAIVSSDYAIKVVNLLYPRDMEMIRKTREEQIMLAKTFL